jgi:ribosomal protein S14
MPTTAQFPVTRGGRVDQTCDRCGPAVRAAYRVDRSGELFLCRHCLNIFRPALFAQGWNIRLIRSWS